MENENLYELDTTELAFVPTPNGQLPFLNYATYRFNNVMVLPIKTRIVSFYMVSIGRGEDKSINNERNFTTQYFCSGTVVEMPNKQNRYRYLVFFDNGFSMYTQIKHTFPIFNHSHKPIERLNLDHNYFLQQYFESYPERLLIRLAVGETVDLYLGNKWYKSSVLDVDVALVKLELKFEVIKDYIGNRIYFVRLSLKNTCLKNIFLLL